MASRKLVRRTILVTVPVSVCCAEDAIQRVATDAMNELWADVSGFGVDFGTYSYRALGNGRSYKVKGEA